MTGPGPNSNIIIKMMIAASYNIVFFRNVNATRLQVQRKNVVNNKLRLP